LASEEGCSVITINGKGFNLATLDWVNFGDPTQAFSQLSFFNLISVTGTKMVIMAPGTESLSVNPLNVEVTVKSVAGQSAPANATYAGVPTVSAVTATSGPAAGNPPAPDTGHCPIDLDGSC